MLLLAFILLTVTTHTIVAQDAVEAEMSALKANLHSISRQVMMQQLATEERVRSSGASGVKIMRLNTKASNPYLTATYSRKSNSAIHDHSNNIRTVGMGEVVVVLNGVEFRTRHNDYRLYMPSTTSSTMNAVEDIPFPEVPEAVTTKATVQEQIDEMRLWFKAFADQNHTVRDYRQFFKPVLCYMEGMWTLADENTIQEPFASDRHELEASSWFDLLKKIRFTSSTGTKSNLENFAFLPTTVSAVSDDGTPTFAQWNYKILCHPLSRDVPLNRFQMVDDFASRMVREYTMSKQELTRAARFQLNPFDTDEWSEKPVSFDMGLMDELMQEVPGQDNYVANLTDNAFGMEATKPNNDPLNAGYYHRLFKTTKKGAMGLQLIHRGFHDENLYVALNSQPTVMGVSYTDCDLDGCPDVEQKVSYAIPLEIIYMTPLYSWNPYNIQYRGDSSSDDAKLVKANGRCGKPTDALAYDGIHSKLYYKTPKEFFGSGELLRDPADTSSDAIAVLDDQGNHQNVSASGTRVFLPPIGDLGPTRIRYPINPVHDEGSVTRKELEALKMAFLELGKYMHMLREPIGVSSGTPESGEVVLKTGDSTLASETPHYHTIEVSLAELKPVLMGGEISKFTSERNGHRHYIKFKWNKSKNAYMMQDCDGKWNCWDGHPRDMYETTDVQPEDVGK